MSYSLSLNNGDLGTTGSIVSLVEGAAKLKQDIDLWLREIYQVDRFHPDYGSVLDNYIGQIQNAKTTHEIEAEIHRVLTNLQMLQLRRLKANPSKFSPDELLLNVLSVRSAVSFDAIYCTIVYESGTNLIQETRLTTTI